MSVSKEKIASGDKEAFAQLFREHSGAIFRLAYSYVREEAAAYDLVQHAFEQAIKNASQYRGDSTPKAWLFSIAVNSAKNYLASRKKLNFEAGEEAFEAAMQLNPSKAPDALLLDKETKRIFAEAFGSLPPKQKEVVRLRIGDEMSFKEIGAALSISENDAKVNYHHAVAKMKKLISAAQGYAPEESGGY